MVGRLAEVSWRISVVGSASAKPNQLTMPRARVRRLPPGTHELVLNLTNRHVHAQLLDRPAGRVVVAAHSNEPSVKNTILGPDDHPGGYKTGSVAAAGVVGTFFGDRARASGVETVTWVRPGKYHGKIKAFIDNVRAAGVKTMRAYPDDMPATKAATKN